jgi:hypothetical protein
MTIASFGNASTVLPQTCAECGGCKKNESNELKLEFVFISASGGSFRALIKTPECKEFNIGPLSETNLNEAISIPLACSGAYTITFIVESAPTAPSSLGICNVLNNGTALEPKTALYQAGDQINFCIELP